MKFKKLMMLAVFMIAILSIGAASAANQTVDSLSVDDDLAAIDDEILEVESNEVLSSSNHTVTSDNFFDYFDDEGNSITDDDLIFEGEFNSPVNHITLSSKNIYGENAVFRNMGVKVENDVTINGLTLISNQYVENDEGALIYANGNAIVLKNIVINYNCPEGQDVFGIFFNDCHDFELSGSQIVFEANNHGEFYEYAIKAVDSGEGVIQGNLINASLPIVDVVYEGFVEGLAQDLSLCIGIGTSEDILIKNNEIYTNVNAYAGIYPTLDTILVDSSSNITISSNKIVETDYVTLEGSSNYLYAIDLHTSDDVLVELNNVSVKTNGGRLENGACYPIQLYGPYTGVIIDRNRLYSSCKGPALGIFSQSYNGATEILIKNNYIDVKGLPTTYEWGLVSGIELQDYYAYVYNNTIHVQTVDGQYPDGMSLYGISYAQGLPSSQNNYDIRNNTIYTPGKYGIYLYNAVNTNVTGNTVHFTHANDPQPVYIVSGDNNNVSDNELVDDSKNIVTPENFFEFFDEDGYLRDNVTFDELVFYGEFNSIVDYIHVSRPLSIMGNNATLNNIGFYIEADDFTLDNIRMVADKSLDEGLIYLNGAGINITNMNIDYRVQDEFAIVINAIETFGLNILNNRINLESHVNSDENSAMAINLLDCEDVVVDNNVITCELPALSADTRDMDYFMMGLITVTPIKVKQVTNLRFTHNILNSTTNEVKGEFPTIQAAFVVGSTNVLIDSNRIKVLDEISALGQDSYLYGINFGYDTNLTFSYNDFNIYTRGGKDSAGTAYDLQGIKSDIKVIGNNITSYSNGPNIGIYVTSMEGEGSDEYIANNFINITGLATASGSWALVTGVEIQNGQAKIYNNTIYTYNVGQYNESAFCYGVSYAQYMYGSRSLDIQDNTIVTEGKYTISTVATKEDESTPILIKNNNLTAHDLVGNESIQLNGIISILPDENETENETDVNITSDMTIDVGNVWINTDNTVTITIPNATGSVTIIINGKTYTAELIDGIATVTLSASDLNIGENTLTVSHNNLENSTSFKVLNGIVNSDNVLDYFNQTNKGRLYDYVPDGVTLDFQGEIKASEIGEFNLYVNKAINMISSTQDAFIDLNTTAGDYDGSSPGNRFTIDKQGSRTNVTGITFHNTQVWIYNADHVTLDNISVIVEDQRVGSGVGATSIRQNSSYATVKNSYFYTRNNGGSSSLVIAWANYCNFDNNTVVAEGNVGNAIYITTYNVGIPAGAVANVYNNVTNNRVTINPMSSGICNGITFSGSHNLIENNTIVYSAGMGITSQSGLNKSEDNIFRNNNITGGASMEVLPNSVVYNNYISGSLRLLAYDIAYNNTIVKGLTIAGDNVNAYNNNILGPVTVTEIANSQISHSNITGSVTLNKNSYNNTLSFNNITGLITINGYENIIRNNYISSNQEYSIKITSTNAINNIITKNTIYSSKHRGNEAVYDRNSKNNVFDNLPLTTDLTVTVDPIKVGQVAVVDIWINENSTGTVKVKFNGVESTVSMNNGHGTYNIPNLGSGTYTVQVIFSGDDVYDAKTESVTFTVSKNDFLLNVDVDVPDRGNPSFTVDLGSDVTGKVTVIINDVSYNQTLENGHATVTVEGLDAGNYIATVTYSGDNKYNPATSNVEFIIKGEPELNVNVESINVGDVAYINISADSRVNSVIVVLNGSHELDLDNGKGVLPVSNLTYGNYTVIVIFSGNSQLLDKNVSQTFNVSKINLSDDIITMDNDYRHPEFTIDLNSDATGNLTVTINNKNYTQVVSNGKAIVNVTDLTPNTYEATVTYSGDKKYNPISKEFNFIIKAEPTINIEVRDILVGETAQINITTHDEIESVILTLNGNNIINLIDGRGNISISDLSAGKYTIKVTFEGNDYIFAKEFTANITVSKHKVSDEVFVIDGTTYVINLPSDATGTFTVKVGDNDYVKPINQGTATVIANENPGTYDVVITYSGDSKYMNASKTTQLTVPKWQSEISANVEDIKVGEDAVFEVDVTEGATGIVNVIINGKKYNGTISDAKALITVSGLSNGTYEAIVNYTGDKNYNDSSITKTFTVSKVDISGEWFNVADTISIALPDDATGKVNIKVGSNDITQDIAAGKAEISYVLTPGTYTATITYLGDYKYNGISGNAQISIPKYLTPMTVEVKDVIVGENVTFKVALPNEATGMINIVINGSNYEATLSNGKAIINVSGLALGNYTAEVAYAGDDNYSANRTTASFSVSKILIPDADQVIIIPETSGSNPSYSIDLEGATGNLTVYVDGKVYKTQKLVNGKATIDVTDLPSGDHKIVLVYSGDDRYASISKETSLHVPLIKLSGSDFTMLYTSGARYKVRLTSDGVGVSGQTIVFTVNGKTLKATTDKNGYASVVVNLPPKSAKYTLTATYNDIKITNKVKVNGIVTAKNVKVKKSAKTLKIKVTLKKVNGKYLKSKKVTLKFNGKTYKVKTNKKGVATFKITKKVIKKLKAGKKYTYKVTYLKETVSKKVTVKK